jgi:hypothetical protein
VKPYLAVATIIGLCFDIVGAFFLSAQAIGLDRIQSWKRRFFDNPSYVVGTHSIEEMQSRSKEVNLRALPPMLIFIATSLGAAIGGGLALAIDSLKLPWLPKYLGLAMGVLVGGAIGAYAISFFALIFRAASSMLVWIDSRTQQGTIGLIGFILLFVGFTLQIIGALSSFR